MGVNPINKFSNKPSGEQLYSKYSVVRRDVINNLVYLEGKLSGKQYVMKQLTTNDQKVQFKVEQLIKHKLSRKEIPTLKLEDVLYQDVQEYCNYLFKVCLIFENPSKDLKLDILERRMKNKMYSQQQLLNIIVSVIQGLKFLKQIDQPHEAVCSKNIFVLPNNEVKLSDPWLNSLNIEQSPSFHIYLSPEKIDVLNSNSQQKCDEYLSDLFSLGVIGLEAYYLQFMNNIYQNKKINTDLIQQKLQSVKYQKLKQLLKGLLGPQRLRYQTVSDISSEYSKKIHVSQSPNHSIHSQLRLGATSPRNNKKKQFNSPRHNSPPTQNFNIRDKHFNTNFSPSRKIGPKFNIPVKKNTFSMNINKMQDSNSKMNPKSREAVLTKQYSNQLNNDPVLNHQKRTVLLQQNSKLSIPSTSIFTQINNSKLDNTNNTTQPNSTVLFDQNIGTIVHYQMNERPTIKKSFAQLVNVNKNRNNKQYSNFLQKHHLYQRQMEYVPKIATDVASFPQRNINFNSNKNRIRTINQVTEHSSTLNENQILDYQFQALKRYAQNQVSQSQKSKITYINGSYYQGNILNGQKNGVGKLYSPNDVIVYNGQWKDDRYHGFGQLKNSFVSSLVQPFSYENMNNIQSGWISYDGEFIDGKRYGNGRLLLANGDVFQGEFVNQRVHGKGKYIKRNKNKIDGQWCNGQFVFQ